MKSFAIYPRESETLHTYILTLWFKARQAAMKQRIHPLLCEFQEYIPTYIL